MFPFFFCDGSNRCFNNCQLGKSIIVVIAYTSQNLFIPKTTRFQESSIRNSNSFRHSLLSLSVLTRNSPDSHKQIHWNVLTALFIPHSNSFIRFHFSYFGVKRRKLSSRESLIHVKSWWNTVVKKRNVNEQKQKLTNSLMPKLSRWGRRARKYSDGMGIVHNYTAILLFNYCNFQCEIVIRTIV